MRFSLTRLLQWSGIALVLLALVGLNYDFDSEAGMRLNSSVEDSIATGVRGYWKLDDGTGTNATDSSGNANTLAMTGSPSWTTGNIGPSALDFSGSGQYLSVTSPASGVLDFAAGASFTITGWFNRDTFANDHTIVAKRNGQTATDDGYIVYIDDATDALVFEASDTADTDEYQMVSSSTFTSTGWHQFAVSWNDAATTNPVNIYIDGALNNGSPTGTFSNIGSLVESVAFAIGAESDGGNSFDGKLDDIRLYGNSLSASEVQKIYQTTAPMQVQLDSGLVGYWTFDGPDIQGTTAIDRSGKGNNGTITGAAPIKGKLGQGLSFNGSSDYVDAGSASSLDNLSAMTIAFWVRIESFPNLNDYVLSKDLNCCGAAVGWVASFNSYYEIFYLEVEYGGGTSLRTSTPDGTFTSSDFGAWTHVAVTWTGSSSASSATFYKNGVALTTSSWDNGTGSRSDDGDYPVTIGSAPNYGGNGIDGSLDDIRIYNRVLSATEVSSLYAQGR